MRDKSKDFRSLINLNGNILCAIDTETTGLIPGVHEIGEIAVIPLDSDFEPIQSILPFNMILKPMNPRAIDEKALRKNGLTIADLLKGMEPQRAADLFIDWIERLGLPPGKRLSPLAHNWVFDQQFIKVWLGPLNFEHYIDGRYRDTQATALYMNDLADIHQTQCPFPKVNLGFCASSMEIQHDRKHTALEDALATARIYKRMLYAANGIVASPSAAPKVAHES